MTADALQRAIKSCNLPLVIYLYGGEPFLQQKALRQIEKVILAPGSEDFNHQVFHGKSIVIEQVLEAVMTLPAFSAKRLVVVKEAQTLSTADLNALIDYIEKPVAETCLVFSGDKIDSRRKFFQILKKKDALVEFKSLSDKQIPAFVRNHLAGLEFSITDDALKLFTNRVGCGLLEVITELEKLTLFAETPRLIDVADIQAVVSCVRAENIFDIGNAVGRQNLGQALTLGRRLVADGEVPLKILFLLTRHFRQLWKARELQAAGRSTREIAKGAGVPPFVVDDLIAQGRCYSRVDFRRAFRLFVAADLAMKSSGSQPEVVLENLLIQLVAGKS